MELKNREESQSCQLDAGRARLEGREVKGTSHMAVCR